jgi:hypothetical protein
MSFFTEASFVMDPNVYGVGKLYTPKPTDGSGDLTFTRASAATRVNSQGLIEKVRTNLVLQSNTFDTASWSAIAATVSSSSGVYFLTEDTTVSQHRIQQNINSGISSGGIYTVSIELKAKGNRNAWIRLNGATITHSVFVDLQNGVIYGTPTGTTNIQSLGDGWYRASVYAAVDSATPTFYLNSASDSFQSTYTGDGTSGIYMRNAQVELSDFGPTDYIPTTTTAVSVGPVANLPRLSYDPTNPDCPSLLLEPQRTNLLKYSEQFNNAAWTSSGTTVTANQSVSSDGYTNADKLTEDSSNGIHLLSQTTAATAGVYTASVFAKANGRNWLFLNIAAAGSYGAYFNLSNGTTGTIQSNITSAKIEDYGNGWYRCSITANTTTPAVSPRIAIYLATGDNTTVYTGDGTSGLYFWGAQLEAGSYATSYIPTLGASVTRLADAAYKTGISSLIGQTEGVIFYDFVWNGNPVGLADYPITIYGASYSDFLGLNTNQSAGSFYSYVGGSNVVDIATPTLVVGQRYKMAFAYKLNDYALYVNGSQIGVDTNAAVPASMANLQTVTPFGSKEASSGVNQLLLFKTRLTNADLAKLTSL